jgi:hypothetical protein
MDASNAPRSVLKGYDPEPDHRGHQRPRSLSFFLAPCPTIISEHRGHSTAGLVSRESQTIPSGLFLSSDSRHCDRVVSDGHDHLRHVGHSL